MPAILEHVQTNGNINIRRRGKKEKFCAFLQKPVKRAAKKKDQEKETFRTAPPTKKFFSKDSTGMHTSSSV